MQHFYINRDISWLSFNHRVLQEAMDKNVPLLERIKFLAIYSSNLDEFYRVRVGHHRNLLRLNKKTQEKLDYDPKHLLREILKTVKKQQENFSEVFEEIVLLLKEQNIHLLRRQNLNTAQKEFVENYFKDHLLPYVQPVLLVKNKIRPFLNNGAIYLIIRLLSKSKSEKKIEEYGLLKIPSDLTPRFITLSAPSSARQDIIMLDDIIRHMVSWLFPGYTIIDTYSIKLTRDAELYIEDEYHGNLVEKIKNSLAKRNVGPPSRFIYDRAMPEQLLDFLKEMFHLDKTDLLPEGRYHNNSDFFQFPDLGLMHLKNPTLTPIPYLELEKSTNILNKIKRKEHLLYFPYQSYDSVVKLFEQAAKDPNVTHIKVVQYRVAKNSKIVNALLEAIRLGKKVSIFIEVKARFDEEANLRWGDVLKNAGAEVHYSLPGLKVHSKLALIKRKEEDVVKLYAYLSTGNFNEDTAKVYTDYGLFTADPRLTKEVENVFSFLETHILPESPFEHLLVGQFNLRDGLIALIQQEIKNAKAGLKAEIILKMNSLQDEEMINLLYKASEAGVKIRLIIRGICCLIPGASDLSKKIKAISIVDRFLEHTRVFYFYANGEEKLYLSSADWMVRNLSHRVETSFPIYNPDFKQMIMNAIRIQREDNVKARILDKNLSNYYSKNNTTEKIRSQIKLYEYYQELLKS